MRFNKNIILPDTSIIGQAAIPNKVKFRCNIIKSYANVCVLSCFYYLCIKQPDCKALGNPAYKANIDKTTSNKNLQHITLWDNAGHH